MIFRPDLVRQFCRMGSRGVKSCIVDFFGSSVQCESIAEEYEDELIEFFSHEAENVKDRLCSKRTGKQEELSKEAWPTLTDCAGQYFEGGVCVASRRRGQAARLSQLIG